MPYTKNLRELRKHHTAEAGGKGAALGELLAAGIPVPPGFVITTAAFTHFLSYNAITVPNAGAILAAKLPAPLWDEIISGYTALNSPFVAVRSSATAEDGTAHAWAGQLESYVPTSAEQLLANIKKCWASLYSPRAIAYRGQAGLASADVSVAVVVQQLIDSEHAGIAFSVHPITGDANHVVVEAVQGLGEAAVGGHVTPDTYIIDKASGEIVSTHLGTQTTLLARNTVGEARWQPLPSGSQNLSPAALAELTAHVCAIESHFGMPMDIEWAHNRGTFYIVQSRPITTLT